MILRHLVYAIHSLFLPPLTKKSAAEIDAKLVDKQAQREAATHERLDPINSMVDLLKLFDLDSSFYARAELWRQMNGEGAYTGSAEQNKIMMTKFRDVLADDQHAF